MVIKVLGQGFESASENSVGNYLMKFFADKSFHSFYGVTAFTSLAGIRGLESHVKNATHLNNISIVTGVDQKGTSKEALQSLLQLGIKSFVFFVPPPSPIFHPKIYLFEGQDSSELIIGSSNLTASGLFTNVEASILISANNKIEGDRSVVKGLKEYFEGLFNFNDPNLKTLTNELIEELEKANIIPTEAERREMQGKEKNQDRKEIQNIISPFFPKRALAKIPGHFRAKAKTEKKQVQKNISKIEASKLLWESGELTERDLNIPKGATTNPTGSMLFKKGKVKDIDQRHYFRDTVFSSLNWVFDTKVGSTHLEKAAALFRIVVLGKDYGTFALTVTHNPRTNTASYEQKNSMTSLSWGEAKNVIARRELIGKSAKLYESITRGEYVLRID